MKNLLPYCLLAFFSLFTLSCRPEEEPVPENILESTAGLKFSLVWDTGSTPEKAIEETDLDLFLLVGHDTAGKSAWYYDFEETELKGFFADGSYILQIDAYKVSKTTQYTLHVSNGGETQLQSFEGTFEAGDEYPLNFMEVKKSGNSYTLKTLQNKQE